MKALVRLFFGNAVPPRMSTSTIAVSVLMAVLIGPGYFVVAWSYGLPLLPIVMSTVVPSVMSIHVFFELSVGSWWSHHRDYMVAALAFQRDVMSLPVGIHIHDRECRHFHHQVVRRGWRRQRIFHQLVHISPENNHVVIRSGQPPVVIHVDVYQFEPGQWRVVHHVRSRTVWGNGEVEDLDADGTRGRWSYREGLHEVAPTDLTDLSGLLRAARVTAGGHQ